MNGFLIRQYETSPITYTANNETNGSYDFSSVIPSGYKAVGVVGFNTGIAKSTIRRIYLDANMPNVLLYSIVSPNNASLGLVVTLLLQKI